MVDDVVRSRATDASRPDRFARPTGRRAYAQRERDFGVCVCMRSDCHCILIIGREMGGWEASLYFCADEGSTPTPIRREPMPPPPSSDIETLRDSSHTKRL